MSVLLSILGLLSLATSWGALVRARGGLRETTLTTAWGGAACALALWSAAFLAATGPFLSPGLLDRMWYFAAVLMLCPPIAVLGSRRPGTRVWTWFILVPLVLVLGWPVLAQGGWRADPPRLALETPAAVGIGLVLVMGFGNYVGTRFTLPALLVGASVALSIAPLLAQRPEWIPIADARRHGPTLLLGVAAAAAWLLARPPRAPLGLDRVWIDFRDTFGIVWSGRLYERIHHTAEHEQWPVRLSRISGCFEWSIPAEAPVDVAQAEQAAERCLRWLLRRFVDPGWIDRRLGPAGTRLTARSAQAGPRADSTTVSGPPA